MLPRRLRLLRQPRLAPSSHSPSLLAIAAAARSASVRRTIHDTRRLSKPAAQLAEQDDDHIPYYSVPSYQAHDDSYRLLPSDFPARTLDILELPSPLPADIKASTDSPQASLYPSTPLLDTLSLISICLRRKQNIPRAYKVFRDLLDSAKQGNSAVPDAEIWGSVLEGIASLGNTQNAADGSNDTWKRRAEVLVGEWEKLQGGRRDMPALGRGGIKVYQGWLAGLVSARAPLTPMIPYLQDGAIPLPDLLRNMKPSDLPLTFEALEDLANQHGFDGLSNSIRELQGLEREHREMQSREQIDEVMPVMESDGKAFSKRKNVDSIAGTEEDRARFSVANLRKTLDALSSPNLPINRQKALEMASTDAARAELEHSAEVMKRTSVADEAALQRDRLQAWMHQWYGQLTERITADIEKLKRETEGIDPERDDRQPFLTSTGMKPSALLLYLTLLPPSKVALITVLELMRMAGSGGISGGMKALRGMLAVGKAIETEYRAETIKNVAGIDSPQWLRTMDPNTQRPSRMLVGNEWAKIGHRIREGKPGSSSSSPAREDELKSIWTPAWSQNVYLGVGGYLVEAVLGVAQVTRRARDPVTDEEVSEQQPAFSHGYEYIRGKKLGVIKLNPVVAERLANDRIGPLIPVKHLPMLIPPQRWTAHDLGGYLIHRVPIMRYKESVEQQRYLKMASEEKHLEPIFQGLDVLSSTPWKINRQVFDIVLTAWNRGEAIADIPPAEKKGQYVMPEKPATGNSDPEARTVYLERVKAVTAQQRKDHAERCKFNYNLEIARSFLHDTFYLPHNMDFRGRAYPIPPHLSPVGDDLCRGLLTFGVKKPLGAEGLKWLQIHLANVYGFDKASFEERARFAQDHEQDIFDSADRPLEGNQWWLKAEDPWQCLATCFDLAAALRSDDPTKFESSLPIHQDGTCNGMQHYAALGGDVRGAKAVNLENGDRPADIYTGVAEIVNKVILGDQKNGDPIALLIPGPLGRKVVKQTVMTTVYGVTMIGARDQIAKQLLNRGEIPTEHIFAVSSYVAKTVLSCIGDLFSGARAIMDWLTMSARLVSRSIPPTRVEEAASKLQVARAPGRQARTGRADASRIAKELMTSVIWTTPLGLPVVQPYRKAVKKQVMTALQSVYISDPNAPTEVSPQKQATAFPPNFIHSLDATHMLSTALKCSNANITFASVHDSYWTHAATVEPMSELIRDSFISLHTQDLIGELREEFLKRYGDHRIPLHSAKSVSASISRKKIKDAARRKQFAAMFGDAQDGSDSDSVTGVTEGQDAFLEGKTPNMSDIPDSAAEVNLLLEGEEEEGGDGDGSEPESLAARGSGSGSGSGTGGIGLSQAEVDILTQKKKDNGESVTQEDILGQRFVKFRDVLPPAPPRGVFDVRKIKDSAYFFS